MVWFYRDNKGIRRAGISIADIPSDCFYIYQDKMFMGSSMEGNCYELFTGNTRAGASFQSVYTSNRNDFALKSIKGAEHYIVEGFIWAGTTIKMKLIFDGGRTSSQLITINASDNYVGKSDVNSMGSYKMGEEKIGGLLKETDGALPFRKIIEITDVNFFDIQTEYKCSTLGGKYKIYYEGLVNPQEGYNLTPN